ncbi:hypothetical protein [Streptomyces sp. NPDC003015]
MKLEVVDMPDPLHQQAKRPVSAALAGPYGHPFHPILVTVPIGAWVASLVFDIASPSCSARAPFDLTTFPNDEDAPQGGTLARTITSVNQRGLRVLEEGVVLVPIAAGVGVVVLDALQVAVDGRIQSRNVAEDMSVVESAVPDSGVRGYGGEDGSAAGENGSGEDASLLHDLLNGCHSRRSPGVLDVRLWAGWRVVGRTSLPGRGGQTDGEVDVHVPGDQAPRIRLGLWTGEDPSRGQRRSSRW